MIGAETEHAHSLPLQTDQEEREKKAEEIDGEKDRLASAGAHRSMYERDSEITEHSVREKRKREKERAPRRTMSVIKLTTSGARLP